MATQVDADRTQAARHLLTYIERNQDLTDQELAKLGPTSSSEDAKNKLADAQNKLTDAQNQLRSSLVDWDRGARLSEISGNLKDLSYKEWLTSSHELTPQAGAGEDLLPQIGNIQRNLSNFAKEAPVPADVGDALANLSYQKEKWSESSAEPVDAEFDKQEPAATTARNRASEKHAEEAKDLEREAMDLTMEGDTQFIRAQRNAYAATALIRQARQMPTTPGPEQPATLAERPRAAGQLAARIYRDQELTDQELAKLGPTSNPEVRNLLKDAQNNLTYAQNTLRPSQAAWDTGTRLLEISGDLRDLSNDEKGMGARLPSNDWTPVDYTASEEARKALRDRLENIQSVAHRASVPEDIGMYLPVPHEAEDAPPVDAATYETFKREFLATAAEGHAAIAKELHGDGANQTIDGDTHFLGALRYTQVAEGLITKAGKIQADASNTDPKPQ